MLNDGTHRFLDQRLDQRVLKRPRDRRAVAFDVGTPHPSNGVQHGGFETAERDIIEV